MSLKSPKLLHVLSITVLTYLWTPPAQTSSDEVLGYVWLAGQDIVGEGRLISTERLLIGSQQDCRRSHADSLDGLVATIAISRLHVGTLSDSVAQVVRRSRWMPGGKMDWRGRPGDRVFFRAWRSCAYLWRPIGDILLISPGDTLKSGDWPVVAEVRLMEEPLEEVRAGLSGSQPYQGLTPFDGALDVVLVRLDAYREADSSTWLRPRFSYSCTGLARLFGSSAQYPDSLRFALQRGCYPSAGPSDTLLVPIPAGFAGGELLVEACPRQWKVENGFVAGLGVPLADVKRKLLLVDGTVHVQRVGMGETLE